MNFGKRTDRATAVRIIHSALDAGINHLDTANMYNDGESERIVGDAVKGRRDALTIATKVGFGRVGGRIEGLSRHSLLAACDASLARLKIDSIDLYYLHVPDPNTPMEDTLSGISSLLETAKIKSWGVSNMASWQILEWITLAQRLGIPKPAMAQQLYSVLVRQLDVEYFAFAAKHEIRTVTYNALAGGLLAGIHHPDSVPLPGTRFDKNTLYRKRYWQPALFRTVDALKILAARHGLSLLELAYAFVFRHPRVNAVLIGPASEAHLTTAISARLIPLSDDLQAEIDAVCQSLTGTDVKYAR